MMIMLFSPSEIHSDCKVIGSMSGLDLKTVLLSGSNDKLILKILQKYKTNGTRDSRSVPSQAVVAGNSEQKNR